MVLTPSQIRAIKAGWLKAEKAEEVAQTLASNLGKTISRITGVPGTVDHLQGDGLGFTPFSNDDTHIGVGDLIRLAESGEDITEDLILSNLAL